MHVVTVTFEVMAEHVDAFRAAVMAQARNSLDLEQACRRFDVCLDPDQPNRVFLYELYDDAAAFDAHLATDHFLTFDALVRPWLLDKHVDRWTRLPNND